VFVRVDEDRLDVLKILITGPADTPYEGGCFVFDMFLPADYPQKPPCCLITTTGGSRVRFNPNLYANGKVCLSLLGTWSGPGWLPSEVRGRFVSLSLELLNS
jgi:ubiquitin-protein ligase